jgi:hypothetical protein
MKENRKKKKKKKKGYKIRTEKEKNKNIRPPSSAAPARNGNGIAATLNHDMFWPPSNRTDAAHPMGRRLRQEKNHQPLSPLILSSASSSHFLSVYFVPGKEICLVSGRDRLESFLTK